MATKAAKAIPTGHTAGIFADRGLDGPEIGTLVAVIDRARNLPNRKTMGKQDPYCAMRLGKEAKKTDTDRRGGQTPKWDQELRFTVHESPDYYKLKCSVFNEDKKNDLIGEVWIDLREVIIAGGGQNDIWHPLHFKGKYAGEIRVELTYYDTRPKEESVLEQQRQRERNRTNSANSSAASGLGGPRQLGPREVKRRPLPAGPLGSSPAVRPPLPDHVHSSPIPALPPSQNSGEQSAHRGIWAPDHQYHDDSNQLLTSHPSPYGNSRRDQRQFDGTYNHSTSQDFSNQQNFYQPQGYQDVGGRDGLIEADEPHFQPAATSFQSSSGDQAPYYTPTPNKRRYTAELPFPPQDQTLQTASSPYISSSTIIPGSDMVRPAPGSGDQRQSAQSSRYGTSAANNELYRDSGLRNSVSYYEIDQYHDVSAGDLEEPPPPPPPAHRERLPQSTPPSNIRHNANTYQIPRKLQAPPVTTLPPDTRSPLQTIERNFDPYYGSAPSSAPSSSRRQDSYQAYSKPEYPPQYDQRHRNNTFPRPSSSRENEPPFPGDEYGIPMMETEEPAIFGDDGIRRRSNGPPSIGQDRPPFINGRSAQPLAFPDMPDQQRAYQSQPPIVKPRAVSPNTRNTFVRKSVSPHPASPHDGRRLSGVPFGPDSYDVLNPATSPTGAVSGPAPPTPEQVKEAARLAEVEKLREQGPIIGNDGREIDPSDHLPSDTWAPEPERKNRKPEVVIRFRTKDDASRTPDRLGSSPNATRPLSMPVAAYNSSPIPVESPSARTALFKIGRNRLQKQTPVRPLPVQPFQHTQSSPAVPTTAPNDSFSTPSPGSRLPPRPALSEYSMLPERGYGSSPYTHGYDPSPPPIPAKVPFYTAGSPNARSAGGMDALSAEMSSIDIGLGNGGRSGGRARRVFEV